MTHTDHDELLGFKLTSIHVTIPLCTGAKFPLSVVL